MKSFEEFNEVNTSSKYKPISVTQTEQWEWTASYKGLSATGSNDQGAVANLFMKFIDENRVK